MKYILVTQALIADVIKNLKVDGDESMRESVAEEFANAIQVINPDFNRTEFLSACRKG